MERNACAGIEDARLDRRLYRPHEAAAVRIAHRARRIARGLRANRSMGNAGCVRWIQRANAGIGTACRRAPWPLRPRTRQTVRSAESDTARLPTGQIPGYQRATTEHVDAAAVGGFLAHRRVTLSGWLGFVVRGAGAHR